MSLPQSSGRPNPVEIDRTERIRVLLGDSWLRILSQFDQFQPDLGALIVLHWLLYIRNFIFILNALNKRTNEIFWLETGLTSSRMETSSQTSYLFALRFKFEAVCSPLSDGKEIKRHGSEASCVLEGQLNVAILMLGPSSKPHPFIGFRPSTMHGVRPHSMVWRKKRGDHAVWTENLLLGILMTVKNGG
jgi:hypothetical protein